MYSESDTIRQNLAFPLEQLPSSPGRASGKALTRGKHIKKPVLQNQLYFKLKVLKHVGQMVSNLKSSIALFSHHLNDQQLSYLQTSQQRSESQGLLRENNFLILIVQAILWLLLWITLWKSSFEVVFEKLDMGLEVSVLTLLIYSFYLLIYFNSKLRNQRQQLITIRSVIMRQYFKERFPKLIPFFLGILVQIIVEPPQSTFLYYITRFIPLTFIPQISVLYSNLQSVISSDNRGEIFLMFARLLGKIILFLHLITMLLNASHNLELYLGAEQTWVETYQSFNKHPQSFTSGELYLLGWYWGTTILCTVGFGDIVPVNNLQRGLVSMLELFSALIFGYFVNYIGHLIKMQGERTDNFETNLRKLNRYLSKANIPGSLKRQARANFFDREEIVKTYNQLEEQEILGNLNNKIKKDIIQSNNLEVLKSASLNKFLSSDQLKEVAYKMSKLIYAPEQTVYSPEDKFADKLWVIEKGKIVERWYDSTGKDGKDVAIYTYDPYQNVLGWINFIKEEAYRLTAKCEAFSMLYQINRTDFMNIIKGNRLDFLKLMEYRDQMIFKGKKYVPHCQCCKKLSHSTIDCPKIHLSKRSAHFLFGKSQYDSKASRRFKKERSNVRYNWQSVFEYNEYDCNATHEQIAHLQSTDNFPPISPRKGFTNRLQQPQRQSVDQILQFVKRCSLRLIEREPAKKRFSSKIDTLSQLGSNKNIPTRQVEEDNILKNFDQMLPDSCGYFEQANYLKVLLKNVQFKSEGRKKKKSTHNNH